MGTGGARYGAGRPAHKLKAEQSMRVDIRDWHRRGLLWDGACNTWWWSRGGERTGAITFRVSEDTIKLVYSVDGVDASQQIRKVNTPCHYGGSRPWFECPVCQNRTALLYMRFSRFACRKCQGISYSTQSGSSHDRVCNLYHRLAALVEDGKPKGQRWATFNRLEDRFQRVSDAFDVSLCWRLEALGFKPKN